MYLYLRQIELPLLVTMQFLLLFLSIVLLEIPTQRLRLYFVAIHIHLVLVLKQTRDKKLASNHPSMISSYRGTFKWKCSRCFTSTWCTITALLSKCRFEIWITTMHGICIIQIILRKTVIRGLLLYKRSFTCSFRASWTICSRFKSLSCLDFSSSASNSNCR